jgi:hypothetical protein
MIISSLAEIGGGSVVLKRMIVVGMKVLTPGCFVSKMMGAGISNPGFMPPLVGPLGSSAPKSSLTGMPIIFG